ncbi:MAG: transposase zinc-binding domain-containing protein [Deltaproteobacteria bacterium]|nr:transposase zinc-binding domain-containing protein [Deltaproteobacteria bacterium]
MVDLVSVFEQFRTSFITKYTNQLLPSHLNALHAISRCRTPDSGELRVRCTQCGQSEWRPLSCGHRSCPKCQNHEASRWLDRQQAKLLPVPYFMVTFTLPYELRPERFRTEPQTSWCKYGDDSHTAYTDQTTRLSSAYPCHCSRRRC